MKRRTALLGGVAGVALAAGAGTALWRRRASDDGVETAAPVDLWSQTFESLAGSPMPMAPLRGRPTLVNFWATWCAPCVTEMPLLDEFARRQKGWLVLALAIDRRDGVERFLAEHRLSLPVALAPAAGIDLSRSLGNTVGALPFTAVFASSGAKSDVHLGALTPALLERWAKTVV